MDHISESFVTIYWVKNTLCCGSGSGILCLFDPRFEILDGKIGIRDKHPVSATLFFFSVADP